MYAIYYLDNVLIISNDKEKYPETDAFFVRDKAMLTRFTREWIDNENRHDTVIYGYEEKKMFHHLEKELKYVEAAGGVVRNTQNRLLFIRRWNIWDLPKGKVDKKEEISRCALREVEEETGVSGLRITGELPVSYHFYFWKDKLHLKKTFWFFMETGYDGPLKPQQEEDITEVEWLDEAGCRKAFAETYRSLRETLQDAVCKSLSS
jgi:8-oxo-dGTP pyrophosphatase MutT (NUDIX family)